MVKLEEITDADNERKQGVYGSAPSSAASSTDSLASVSSTGSDEDDSAEIEKESLTDRLTALVDIIPPKTRHALVQGVSSGASALRTGGRWIGSAVWIFSTSALLVALPLALVLEDEAKIVQQEKEILAQQQGQQMLAAGGNPFAPPPQGQSGLVPPGF
ncbi:mitochondrial import translocase, subunit Tom22 [Clavulina sp. PMI_390]|nr:mitochondrial import translocase, subunit Tom22 [Clavulina sp. PMI_390]